MDIKILSRNEPIKIVKRILVLSLNTNDLFFKKLIILLFAVFLAAQSMCCTALAAYNSEISVEADIAYMVSLDRENTVIYDKNANVRFSPAAITKIVTGIVTIENCANLDQKIILKKEAVTAAAGTGSAMAGLYPEEEISIRDLLYCTLVYNAADAACNSTA